MLHDEKIFLDSAHELDNVHMPYDNIMSWFASRQKAHHFVIEQIPFVSLKRWCFDTYTGNLCHDSGRFFTIEGIKVKTSWGNNPEWDQPIINQPEIGFLGFIVKKIKGVLHFLVQAKMEPGNINMIQLAPTLQATRSNFTLVHQGRKPLYLEYFMDRSNVKVLVDSLQSEQGARFLCKRNRNIIIEAKEDLPVHDDYCWMTLGQILKLMRHDNIVNMDARTVLSCVPYSCSAKDCNITTNNFAKSLLRSLDPQSASCYSNEEIISWFTEMKFKFELNVNRIPLNAVRHWIKTDNEIRHETGKFFSIIACSVEADNREVKSWTQPLFKAHQQGLIAFIIKQINGTLHFLIQAKVEPGNFDIVEMAPTVQCLTGSYEDVELGKRPPFTDYVLSAKPEQIRFDTLQSEEGGRFFREENRNIIIEADEKFPSDIPENYIWMTAYQLKEFIKYNNFLNVQARCLLASLSFM